MWRDDPSNSDAGRGDQIVPQDGRLVTIDLLRGLAILWVIILHIWQPVTLEFGPRRVYYERFVDRVAAGDVMPAVTAFFDVVFRMGDHGVTMFMILSGLSLTMTTLRRGGRGDARRYYGVRLRKLLMPYWFAWAFFVASLALLAWYRTSFDGGSFQHNFQWIGFQREMSMDVAIEGLLIVPRGLSLENTLAARPPALWFVLLLVQYYLIFPLLLPVLTRIGALPFAALSIAVSIASSSWMVWALGDISGAHGYIWSNWMPFRVAEFGVGMALGYALIQHPAVIRDNLSRLPVIALAVVAGIAMHTAGAWLEADSGYVAAISYALIVGGLSVLMLNVIAARPGLVLRSAPIALLAWVGTMSYAALITNEAFRLLNWYFIVHGWLFSTGWWYFIIVLYVPLTVVLAYPVALVLGLLPPPARPESRRDTDSRTGVPDPVAT